MKELEADIECPRCHTAYGRVFRVPTEHGWVHEPVPDPIPTYCSRCEVPTERVRR